MADLGQPQAIGHAVHDKGRLAGRDLGQLDQAIFPERAPRLHHVDEQVG